MKGYFRKRGDKWSFTIDIGVDPATGKRKQKTKSGFKTKKEAQSACASIIDQIQKGYSFNNDNVKLGEFLDHWLEAVAKHRVKPSTFINYNRALQRRVKPVIGLMKIKDLRLHHGEKMVNDMINEDKSPRYIEYTFTVLGSALKHAIKTELILKNPFEFLELPRARRRNYEVWDNQELIKFINFLKMDNLFYMVPLVIAAQTGLRRSEFLGLTWDKIDYERKKLIIDQSLMFDEVSKGFVFGDLKRESSYRTITINDSLITLLKEHRRRQSEMKLAHGQDYDNRNLVCCMPNGKPIYPRQLSMHMDKISKLAGLKKIRIHDLRHSHATMLLRLGENTKIVSERLGHGSTKITADTYSHVTPDMQENTAQKIEQAFNS
ncbi:site-specific integrase [Shouchella miscanthi]|uniref:site-specific integrase n=1 Tax=Shouchella miscanthi TaxID=2598861 RepID=UPI0011A3C046|nr:site-specific integrase [Shouchella miscanthi]